MEAVKLKSPSGTGKVAGVALCLAGVAVIALYKGPALNPVNHHHRAFGATAAAGRRESGDASSWVKWTFLMVVANTAWSLWIVLQAALLREYPNKMAVTAVQCVFSAVQSLVVAVAAERDMARWKLRLDDVGLLAVAYSGVVVMGVAYYLQAWFVELESPVFLAAWTPLCFALTTFCSSFLAEIVHPGSVVGGILLVGGLYGVLWGKSKEDASHDQTAAVDDDDDRTAPTACTITVEA